MHPTPQLANLLLVEWSKGNTEAELQLRGMIAVELTRLMGWYLRGEPRPRMAQDSALLQQVYLRLMYQHTTWQHRARFLEAAAPALRQILANHARSKCGTAPPDCAMPAIDQPEPWLRQEPNRLIALDDALLRIAQSDPLAAQVAELRLFADLSIAELAASLDCEPAAVTRAWRAARAALTGDSNPEPCFRVGSTGGSYGLDIYLDDPSDACLQAALEAMWSHPSLDGCYKSADVEPHLQEQLSPAAGIGGILYGVGTLPGEVRVRCGSGVSRWGQREGTITAQTLGVSISLESLSRIYPIGGYPFGEFDAALYWRPILDSWLLEIARAVHERVPYEIAEVGFDLALTPERMKELREGGAPQERADGLLIWEDAHMFWHPPTRP